MLYQTNQGLTKGKAALRLGELSKARSYLTRYLWLRPSDSEARLMMAESLVRDDQLTVEHGVKPAIEHLQRVPDSSEFAAEARTREGRLRFLILHQPAAAEKLFHAAIDADPNAIDAYLMLWKLLEMTSRQRVMYFRIRFWRHQDQERIWPRNAQSSGLGWRGLPTTKPRIIGDRSIAIRNASNRQMCPLIQRSTPKEPSRAKRPLKLYDAC